MTTGTYAVTGIYYHPDGHEVESWRIGGLRTWPEVQRTADDYVLRSIARGCAVTTTDIREDYQPMEWKIVFPNGDIEYVRVPGLTDYDHGR